MPREIVQPNRGATVPDVVAVGKEQYPEQNGWRNEQSRESDQFENAIPHAVSASESRWDPDFYDRYVLPLTLRAQIYLTNLDFGMQIAKRTDTEVWFKGYGSDQYVYYACQGPKQFLGGTFEAQIQEDLDI